MNERLLLVGLGAVPAGLLTLRGNLCTFEFLESYLDLPGRPVLGQFFEEDPRGRWRQAQRVPTWFSNLLPEDGPLKDFLAKELDIRAGNEFNFLEVLGHDLPGSVSVQLVDTKEAALSRRIDREGPAIERISDAPGGVRFSAAGVQLKLSVIHYGNTVRLPGEGELGDQFVKFPGTIPGIPENEYAMMSLAKYCNIDVPPISLVRGGELQGLPEDFKVFEPSWVYMIERFDRRVEGKVHIEDLNQVINNWPERKYDRLNYETLGVLIKELCGTRDAEEYIRRLLFNIAVGNEDAHLKNWSIMYPDAINPRLAPLYDVVATVVLPGLSRDSALKFHGSKRPQSFSKDGYLRLAGKMGLPPTVASGLMDEVFTGIRVGEQDLRSAPWLSSAQWESIGSYRRSVPLLRQLMN